MQTRAQSRARGYRLESPPPPTEHALQKQIADVLTREIAPAGKVSKHCVTWFAIDHADFAGAVPGIRIARGIIAGIPDLVVLHRGRAHWIELKSETGRLEIEQKAVLTALLVNGCQIACARDAFDVLALLDEWKIPRLRFIKGETPA